MINKNLRSIKNHVNKANLRLKTQKLIKLVIKSKRLQLIHKVILYLIIQMLIKLVKKIKNLQLIQNNVCKATLYLENQMFIKPVKMIIIIFSINLINKETIVMIKYMVIKDMMIIIIGEIYKNKMILHTLNIQLYYQIKIIFIIIISFI